LNELRKIQISIPDKLLKEIDLIVEMEKTNRSEFVREAMRLYIGHKRRMEMRDKMKNGYQEMAGLNIMISEYGFKADYEQQVRYEEKLREMECVW
jgi:CopG family transcriptional regulator / antitoxin EndoAI